jgi:hypothetical protein
MRTEKCLTCRNYTPQPEDQRTGREWMNATGWCDLPRLHTKRRRIDQDNWCDQYSEKDMPQTMTDLMVSPETIDAVLADAEADSFAVESTKSFEHWRLTIREKLVDIKKQLDELDTLVNTPYEDLE